MATLFNLPKAVPVDSSGQPYPGAKLYFYAAGTTTAQLVYTDVDITTPHAQPVVADASGRFAPIYLNPDAAANYRVQLKTASNVLIYDVDDIPLGASGGGGGGGSSGYPITTKETAAGLVEGDLDLSYPTGDLRRYQAEGDGIADDSEAIEYAFASNYNGAVYFTPGATYKTTRNIAVTANTQVFAEGAAFSVSHTGTAFTLTDDVSWHGGTFTGPGSTYSANSKCLVASGVRNGAGVAPTYSENISIYDVSIDSFGSTAIDISFSRDVTVVRPRITNVGYIGVIGYSCQRMRVIEPYIDTISGETGSGELNAYGVTFTSLTGASVNITRDPVSSECEVKGGMIRNIPTWHALDTHGGSYIKFEGVTIYNCRRGAVLTSTGTTAAQNCVIDSCYYCNELSGLNSNDTEKISEAIWDIGISDSVRNSENTISNNVIVNGGRSLGVGGAIFVQFSSGCAIKNNTLRDCRNQGVYVAERVRRLTIDGNTFIDVHGLGTGAGGPSNVIHGVLFNGDYFQNCAITNNSFLVQNSAIDNYVLNSGVTIPNYTNRSVHIDNNAFSGVTDEVVFSGATYTSQTWGNNITGGWSNWHPSTDSVLTSYAFATEEKLSLGYSKHGNAVTLRVGGFSGKAGNKASYYFYYLPTFLHPQQDVYGLCRVKTAASPTPASDPSDNWRSAAFIIAGTTTSTGQASGALLIYRDTAGSQWGATDYRGHESFTVSYSTLFT